MSDKIKDFLMGIPLFANLSEEEMSLVVGEIVAREYTRNTILAVQGRTNLDCVYIIETGAMELFYETDGQKSIKGVLEPGDTFGGVSILMNAGVSVRTVQVVGDATLYILPKGIFLDMCTRNKDFYEHFVSRFRKEM